MLSLAVRAAAFLAVSSAASLAVRTAGSCRAWA